MSPAAFSSGASRACTTWTSFVRSLSTDAIKCGFGVYRVRYRIIIRNSASIAPFSGLVLPGAINNNNNNNNNHNNNH